MIQEAYVSFNVAKLLIEKGFNEPTLAYAYGQDMISYYSRPKVTDPLSIVAGRIPLPTQQMAMRWLREEHKINIEVRMLFDSWDYCVQRIPNHEGLIYQAEDIWKSYEAACNAALYYCVDNLTEDLRWI